MSLRAPDRGARDTNRIWPDRIAPSSPSSSNVFVVSGSQQALDVVARVLLDIGDPVWMEEPGYLGARAAFAGAGGSIIPVPVDEEGLDVAAGIALEPAPKAVYVTPSHQLPIS